MLAVSRRLGERIELATENGTVVLTVLRLSNGKVRLGIEAPPSVSIRRGDDGEDSVVGARRHCREED